ncbi:SCP2 domain-containing protein [Pseudomonadota bacterium]
MPGYRTPLPGILAAMLESAVNRLLDLDEDTPERFDRLEGRMLKLDIEGVGITLYFAFNGGQVEVGTRSSFEPDTVISGSPAALFSMAVPDDMGSWGSPDSRVSISGDANLARDLERLFSRLDPDWEGRLSRIFGDVWGHQVAAGLRAGAEQARESAGQAGVMISEYLQQNQSPVVRNDEVEAFAEDIESAREWAESLESRIQDLEESSK